MKIAFTSNESDFISQSIQFFTKDKAKIFPISSHCFPIIGEIHGVELGLSADEVLISIIDVNRYRRNLNYNLRIYEVPDVVLPSIWIQRTIEENNQKIYPHLELIWFIIEWARNKILPDDPNDKNWIDYSKFCSELTAETLKAAGYSGWIKGYDSNSLTPTELESLVKAIPHCKLIEERVINIGDKNEI
jgi:hypothetical protein